MTSLKSFNNKNCNSSWLSSGSGNPPTFERGEQNNKQRKHKSATHLGVSGVCVKYVTEKLAGNGNTSDNQPMNIIGINNKRPSSGIGAQLAHPIKIHQQSQKHLIRSGTIF
jgi:hypothetical protein